MTMFRSWHSADRSSVIIVAKELIQLFLDATFSESEEFHIRVAKLEKLDQIPRSE